AELREEDAPQVPAGDPEARGERIDPRPVHAAVLDQTRRGAREARRRVDRRIAGCELRAAAQARSEAGRFRGGRAREEAAVLALRHPDGADRTAVDARRGHRDEEAAVEARVAGAQGAVAG